MITGHNDPSADYPKLPVPGVMEWRVRDGRFRVPGALSGARRRSSNQVVDIRIYNDEMVWFILVPLSAPYGRRGLPPVLLDAFVMSCESDGVPPNGSDDPGSIK